MLFRITMVGSNDSKEQADCINHGHVDVRVIGIHDEAAARMMMTQLIKSPASCPESMNRAITKLKDTYAVGDTGGTRVEVIGGAGELFAANPVGEKFSW